MSNVTIARLAANASESRRQALRAALTAPLPDAERRRMLTLAARSQQGRSAQPAPGAKATRRLARNTDINYEYRLAKEIYEHQLKSRVRAVLAEHEGDPRGLAEWVASTREGDVAVRVLDDVGVSLAVEVTALPSKTLYRLAYTNPDTRALFHVVRMLRRAGYELLAQPLVTWLVDEGHARLYEEDYLYNPKVSQAMKSHGAHAQSVAQGSSGVPIVFDEYAVVIDKMPPGLTPEGYLAEMALDLNKAVNSSAFDRMNTFERTEQDRRRGAPAVGDVYDIDIVGPINGSVMLVELVSDHFVFLTVSTSTNPEHPESGSREFGFKRLGDGGIRFYTRGVSAKTTATGYPVAFALQSHSWYAMVEGIGDELERRGGKVRPDWLTVRRSLAW